VCSGLRVKPNCMTAASGTLNQRGSAVLLQTAEPEGW